MAAALEREQIPQPSDAYVREQLAWVGLVARIGTFSGLQGEDVRQFCDNVDGLQSRYGLGSWEMADIVIPQLRGDAATEVEKYLAHPQKWPNADHWCAQAAQNARAFQQHVALQPAQGNVGEPGYVPMVPHQPELPKLPQLKLVTEEQCLKAYLIAAFEVQISIAQALKIFQKHTQQAGNWSMRAYFNRVRTACTKYHKQKYSATQREAAGYAAIMETDLMEAVNIGMIDQFAEYLESIRSTEGGAATVANFDQVEAAAIKWETTTKAGSKRLLKCKPVPTVASAMQVDSEEDEANQGHTDFDDEDDIPRASANANLGEESAKGGTSSSKGGRSRGGKGANNGTKSKDSRKEGGSKTGNEPIEDPRYKGLDWWPENEIPPELKSKEKRCFYCGGLGHPRPRCPHLKEDLNKVPPVDRRHMPKRGTYKSRRQVKREKEMAKVSAAALQQLQLQIPGHFYATPQQAYPLSMGGRPPVTPYPPQLPTRQATPISPMQPSFYAPGAAPLLPQTMQDGRAFTHTGNFPQGPLVTRLPYYPGEQVGQRSSDPSSHCYGPTVADMATMQGAGAAPQPRPHSTVSHMGAFGPYQADGQT